MLAKITVHAPDAFYNPPVQVPSRLGALLRSEPQTSGCARKSF